MNPAVFQPHDKLRENLPVLHTGRDLDGSISAVQPQAILVPLTCLGFMTTYVPLYQGTSCRFMSLHYYNSLPAYATLKWDQINKKPTSANVSVLESDGWVVIKLGTGGYPFF